MTLKDEIDIAAATCSARPTLRRVCRPVRGRDPVDERRADAARPPLSLKIGTKTVGARSAAEVQGQRQHPGARGGQDARAERDRHLQPRPRQPIAFDAYVENREIGGFIIIDRFTNNTVGMGLIRFALRRAHNIHWQAVDVDRAARADLKRRSPPCCGSPGSRVPASRPSPTWSRSSCMRRATDLPARRRQRAPRPQPGPRLLRCRPRGEHPPRGRGGEADGGCGPHRARLLHLALPLRAPDGARAGGRGRVHRDLRRHSLRKPRSAT